MSNATYPNPGIKWGLIAGAIGIIAGIIVYLTDVPMLFSLKFGILLLVIYGVCGLLAGLQRKKQEGGYIGFKNALQPIFATFVIAALMGTIFTYVLANFIDNTLAGQMKEANIKTYLEMASMQRAMGTSQQEYEQGLEMLKNQDYQVTLAGSLLSYLRSLFQYFVVSAILSLIIRKKQIA
jgi:uncharacterized membrane protein (DUF106 family)